MVKATQRVQFYNNENGPIIGVTSKNVIEVDGFYFKDINGDGKLHTYKDWRKSPQERAEALAKELSIDDKIGHLFINQWKMGLYQEDKNKVDATGLLDEAIVEKDETIFNVEKTYGSKYTVKEMGIRNFIFRQNPKPEDLVDWINEMNSLAEECEHAIPILFASNSRNEHGEVVFGMNDAAGVFATWPGTMGIAAAVKGDDVSLIDDFADCIREEWNAVGLKKGYMYMADVMTDPRWQRTFGTFGEDPSLVSEIIERLIPRIQGSEAGVTTDGIAMTVKHFPGGGARENGFDPHYAQGQWNVYQTENSLQRYHLPAFQVAINKKASSIMPYYAKLSDLKSAPQYDQNGNKLEMKAIGMEYNQFLIEELLRTQMGFEGYTNSDSGITHKMSWGVEELEVCERVALAINSGVDIISGSLDVESAKEAYERAQNGYYTTQGNKVPEGYTVEQITLSEETITKAVTRTLKEKFELGIFENPYRIPEEAVRVTEIKKHWKDAYDTHLKSVVLLKNVDQTLPLAPNKLEGKKVYVECFKKVEEASVEETQRVRKLIVEKHKLNLTDCYEEADYAILFVNPSSGEYFNATKGFLELDICEGKVVPDVDGEGRPAESTHLETTLYNVNKIAKIYNAIHKNGGKVIANINFTLAWMVGNVENYADALCAGFDTFTEATMDVIMGNCNPTGKMPITLPKNDDVLAVNQEGVCISPNDVPGYEKDQYMPEELKDENGKAYAYRDQQGNYYEFGFGLQYN